MLAMQQQAPLQPGGGRERRGAIACEPAFEQPKVSVRPRGTDRRPGGPHLGQREPDGRQQGKHRVHQEFATGAQPDAGPGVS